MQASKKLESYVRDELKISKSEYMVKIGACSKDQSSQKRVRMFMELQDELDVLEEEEGGDSEPLRVLLSGGSYDINEL